MDGLASEKPQSHERPEVVHGYRNRFFRVPKAQFRKLPAGNPSLYGGRWSMSSTEASMFALVFLDHFDNIGSAFVSLVIRPTFNRKDQFLLRSIETGIGIGISK